MREIARSASATRLSTDMGMKWRVIPDWPMYEMSEYGLIRNATSRLPIAPSEDKLGYRRYTLQSKSRGSQRVYERKLWKSTWPDG